MFAFFLFATQKQPTQKSPDLRYYVHQRVALFLQAQVDGTAVDTDERSKVVLSKTKTRAGARTSLVEFRSNDTATRGISLGRQ